MTSIAFLTTRVISDLLLPPAGPLLLALICIPISLAAKHRLWKRFTTALAVVSLISLCVLSMPIVGTTLLASLEQYPPLRAEQLKNVQAIVILGGGKYGGPEYGGDTVDTGTLERLRYGVHLARASKLPILVTGGAPLGGKPEGEAMREALMQDFGLDVRWIETGSRNTSENASGSAQILKAAGISRIALVSQGWHLVRAVPMFEREGFSVLPAPTGFVSRPPSLVLSLLPSDGYSSRVALHEYLGMLFNHLFG
jgi:uncharacterized SAM-binding protein YcdF (DUF218 family)